MKYNLIFLFVLLLFINAATVSAELRATVDREIVDIDETLVLTITKDSSSFFTGPELDPLRKDFEVLSQSQQSNMQIVNGSRSSTVAWKVILSPKRVGNLEIPSITLGKEKTEPLSVQVIKRPPIKRSENSMFFIETDIDAQEVYVQGQVLFTLRIYWAVNAQVMDPEDPEVPDAILARLDDTSYDKVINGRTYKVYERKYALFPQKSGILEIPAMSVQVVRQHGGFRDPFGSFGNRGDKLVLRSESKQVKVLEKPAEYPAGADWLPASGLTIADEWSGNPMNLASGDSITLTLTIRAEGLMAEQLPPIETEEPDGINLYQGKAELENISTSTGILGIRKESIALIPTRFGTIELPEIRIPWWDKVKKTITYAVVPAQQLVVHGTAPQTEAPAPTTELKGSEQNTSTLPVQVRPSQQVWSPVLFFVGGLFAIAWLITLFLLIHTRRQLKASFQEKTMMAGQEGIIKEKEAYEALAGACRKNDPVKARNSVMAWARAFWVNETVQTYTDIEKIAPGSGLLPLLSELDSSLYSQENSSAGWQGNSLLEQVKKVRRGRGKMKDNNSALQKLYK